MGAMSEIPRVCATCRHFEFESGAHYDSYDEAATISCKLGHWSVSCASGYERSYREAQLTAVVCPDYELVQVAPPVEPPPVVIERLRAEHPEFAVGLERSIGHHRAYYEKGSVGRTTSPSFNSETAAVEWLAVRLAEMAREA